MTEQVCWIETIAEHRAEGAPGEAYEMVGRPDSSFGNVGNFIVMMTGDCLNG